MISEKNWDAAFGDFYLHDCAVRSKHAFSFACIEAVDDFAVEEPNKRMVNVFTDTGEIDYKEYTGFAWPFLAVARQPLEQAVMVGARGGVAVLGSGQRGMEAAIPMGSATAALVTSVNALATIDGLVYAAGPWRAVCRRTACGVWESLAGRDTLPEPERDAHGSNDEGFDVIDGFSARDIYCAGGKGDVWRFDGVRWHQCRVRVDQHIQAICCAGDGYVYIGLQGGGILRGRENLWKLIQKTTLARPFNDMVWFADKVWCNSDDGLWTIGNGKLADADVPPEARHRSRVLAVGDGVMLFAGRYGAVVFDGKEWTPLVPDAP
ncbi:hypothetical protein [Massilia genomosp. 1]|uniref:Uncharacterized protein n=1 Tax=Massilia genomosp. 1 TaxID=2609280 RepID=A0ABX0MS96_9BURK|nr:hypothetical protein [Massilia genomosp. 1]NHZ65611.1 hypothetical protein [Massilia genomosp. 1]